MKVTCSSRCKSCLGELSGRPSSYRGGEKGNRLAEALGTSARPGRVCKPICAAIADSLGTATQPAVQTALADAMVYLETLRAFVQAAEANPVRSPSGLALPNPTTALAARTFAIERYPSLLQHIRELCGPGILMAPGQADLHHPDIGPHLHRYFVARDEGATERFRLFKLAWEYACDSF